MQDNKEKRIHKLDKAITYNLIKSSKEKINHGRLILFAIAALNIVGLLQGISLQVPFIIGFYSLIIAFFVALGFYVNKSPKKSIIIGLSVYLGLNALYAIVEPSSLFSGIVFKIIIIAALIKAYIAAKEAEELQGKLEEIESKIQ